MLVWTEVRLPEPLHALGSLPTAPDSPGRLAPVPLHPPCAYGYEQMQLKQHPSPRASATSGRHC